MKTETGKIKLWTVLLTTAIVGLGGCASQYVATGTREPRVVATIPYETMSCSTLEHRGQAKLASLERIGRGECPGLTCFLPADQNRESNRASHEMLRIIGAFVLKGCRPWNDDRPHLINFDTSEVSQ